MAGPPSGRAQSEVIAAVLLVAIVISGVIAVGLVGGRALADLQRTSQVSQAEHELRAFDERVSGVALSRTDATSHRLSRAVTGRNGALRTVDGSWLRVTMVNGTTHEPTTVANASMGTVTSVHGGTTIALEGGGVWRSDGQGGVMLSPPEVRFHDGTLTVPVIAVSGDRSLDDSLELRRNGTPERRFPNASAGFENRIRDGDVVLTVHSSYYEAWGRYLDRSTAGLVTYDHGNDTVSVKFLTGSDTLTIRGGIVATAGAGELRMEGSGAYTDSYDSSEGDYAATKGRNGTILAAGVVDMTGNSTVKGDLRSGDTVRFSGGPTVTETVYWTSPPAPSADDVDGEDGIEQIDGVPAVEPVDGFVERRVDELRGANNNSAASVIQDDRISLGPGASGELTQGRYYLDSLHLHGGSLELNTSDGDLVIAVRDWAVVERENGLGGNLTVAGDGEVRVFVASERETAVSITGQGERRVNLHVGKESSVHVPGENSTRLRVFGPRHLNASIAGSNSEPATFDGVIYAPAGMTGPGWIYVKHAHNYGAFVTGTLTIGKGGAIHYDQGLERIELPRSPTVARIEYMHVTVHRVTVTG